MKLKFWLLLVVVGSWLGIYRHVTILANKPAYEALPSPAQSQTLEGIPQRLLIPKIGVDAEIVPVAMDKEGRMATPPTAQNTGWWSLGEAPGGKGSAVVDGHFDDPQGNPGVFYRLGELDVGDQIMVEDDKGVKRVFEVYKIAKYNDAEFPLRQVFADKSGSYLNLITCAGVWDAKQNNYQERLVVFAELR